MVSWQARKAYSRRQGTMADRTPATPCRGEGTETCGRLLKLLLLQGWEGSALGGAAWKVPQSTRCTAGSKAWGMIREKARPEAAGMRGTAGIGVKDQLHMPSTSSREDGNVGQAQNNKTWRQPGGCRQHQPQSSRQRCAGQPALWTPRMQRAALKICEFEHLPTQLQQKRLPPQGASALCTAH